MLECRGDSVLGVLFTKAPDFSITGNVRSSGAGWKRIPVGPFSYASEVCITLLDIC